MNKGFTLKCNNCGKEIQIKSVQDLYTLHTKEIAVMNHCEETYGFIGCSNCGQEYKFDLEKKNDVNNIVHTKFKKPKAEKWSEPITKEEGLKYLNEGKFLLLIGDTVEVGTLNGYFQQAIIDPKQLNKNIIDFPKIIVDSLGNEMPIKEIRVWK